MGSQRRLVSLFSHIYPKHICNPTISSVRVQRTAASSSAIVSHKAEVNGVNIHYEQTGSGSRTVLLLPGGLGSARIDFGPQLEKLNKEKFTVICWDPRGYGKSIPPERTWPLDYLNRDADDAHALLKKLGLSQVSLVGFSDGGRTAMIMAGQHPELFSKLVIWGAYAFIGKSDMAKLRVSHNTDEWNEHAKEPFIRAYGEEYFHKHWEILVQTYNGIYTQRKGNLCIDEVPKIRCPTLILHGLHDALISEEHVDYLHKNIKNSRLLKWPNAGHHLHLKYVDDFNRTVEDFLLED